GLLSRVTESVKNIVPGWLQKYFNKREDKCVDVNESANEEENPVNYHHDYANEDAMVIDGRVTPESARINLEEPSTSRSALNFSDVLTRPSLHRSHLNCTVLDSTVPHCQPSTSSTLGIGSPGLSLVKEIKDSTSQHDDDNISTTSGFSSRASDKDITVSKNTSAPLLWSPEAERSHSLSQHPASSSKKPAFNLSAFGSPSPSLGNTSVFKTRQLGDSPFYPGKTSYGGAAAAARQTKVQISAYQPPIKRQMKAKQANVQSYGVTSSTARRILQTLEKMSSPLADAKRIPSPVSSPLSSPVDRSVLNMTSFQSRQNQVDSQHPPVQKLVTPKPISLTGSRITYFKPSLKSATNSRKIHQRVDTDHQSTNSILEVSVKKRQREAFNLSYPKLDTPASNGLSSGGRMDSACGKMRRERERYCASRPGQKQELEMEQEELPEVPLPISTASLPTFNFSCPASSAVSSSPSIVSKAVMNKVNLSCILNVGSPTFVFSSPIVKSTEVEVLPPLSQIKFTFSVPVVKSSELSSSTDTPVTSILSPGSATVNSTSNKKEEEEYDGFCKPAKFLKQGSVLDILKSPGFMSGKSPSCSSAQPVMSTVVYTRPAISSFSAAKDTSKQASSFWQSDTHDQCLQNKATDGKCVTCEATKVSTAESTKQTVSVSPCVSSKTAVPTVGTLGFEDKFKPAPNTWDCDTCLVQNKPEATKCIACDTPKPGTGVMPALTMPVVTDNSVTVTSTSSSTGTTVTLGFGDKFKQPKGSWNCSVCLLQNKAEDSKCVACQSEKPGSSVPVTSSSVSASSGGFLDLDKFKMPEGSWECEVCLVQNKAEATKCIACQSAKPGTKAELKGFGTATVSTNTAMPSFTFGVPSSSSEPSQTLSSTGSFKFGEQSSFKFGIASESASSNTVTGGFKFPTGSGNFKFGVPPSDSKSEDSKKESKNNSFTFGLPSTSSQAPSTFQFGTTSLGQQEKKEEPVLGGFGFAASSTSSIATNENKTGVGGFTFGTVAEKDAASPALPFKKSDEKKDETVSTKGVFSFGSVESAPASQFVLGRAEENQDSVTSAGPLAFGKKADNEELKAQPIFSSGTAENTKEESTAKPVFNFSFGKPPEKESEQAKAPFAFGAPTSTCDQGASFSFLSSNSSSTVAPTTSANSSSVFGSTLASSNPQPVPAPFVFGQPSNTVTTSVFGNPAESATSQSFGFSQENKPATTSSSTGSTLTPFLFRSGESSTNAANSGFTFGATTTSNSTGSSSSFLFGSGPAAPAAGPAFGASQLPAFGPSPGSGQQSAPSFGSLSTPLFSAGSQPAPSAFGSVTSSTQPSVFGQQAAQQPAFGSGTPSAGSVFQFGSNTTNFSFPNNPGVFTFGANPPASAAPAPPSGTSGFLFNQPPAFTVGTNGKNVFSASGSSVAGRKIKTAIRRRK
ncbi:NU153 protein, partial [Setophaga kirtlandii]|nr:NU153 protein [Setophaga kirtlandii]